jgi:hypothetical protein
MRKIIDGKLYDTDKAKRVGGPWSPAGFGPGDFDWCEEALYRKRTGEYFLHGEGGTEDQVRRAVRAERGGPAASASCRCPTTRPASGPSATSARTSTRRSSARRTRGRQPCCRSPSPAATYHAIKSEAARRGCSMRDMVVEWAATLARD